MPAVQFNASKTIEEAYVRGLLAERTWFERQEFDASIPGSLPAARSYLRDRGRRLVEKMKRVERSWRKIEPGFFSAVRKLRRGQISKRYGCHVSPFGPSGKFRSPRTIFLRLRKVRDEREGVETIGHELLHLCFARLFARRRLSYREREGMVDALVLRSGLRELFPSYRAQSIGKIRPKLLREILG